MWRRAARERRIVAGLLLIVVAAVAGGLELHRVTSQADRDFALCGGTGRAPECVSKQRPISVNWVSSSSNGFRREYGVSVQTSPKVTFSIGGMNAADVQPFEGLDEAEVRYRQGRLVAIVAPGGTSLKVPFAFSRRLAIVAGTTVLLGLLGAGSIAWGFTRVNRTPRP